MLPLSCVAASLIVLSGYILFASGAAAVQPPRLLLACETTNDLLVHLPAALKAARYASAAAAIGAASSGDTVMVLADGYPSVPTVLSAALFAETKARGAKLFVEFPAAVPGLTISSNIEAGNMTFQRLVVATDAFASSALEKHRLLYAHGAQ